ncbi:unnamed protein product [Anisakis simplex]|uniref:Uncharacterized protein n=1 Tax=Anisakis simplex TaxID=6269 RepID=A0A0M3K999_ANISI|nr:unnamed protein product [Anisakis simplex]
MASTRVVAIVLVLLQIISLFCMVNAIGNERTANDLIGRFKRQYYPYGGSYNYGGGVDNNYGGTDIGSINVDNTDITV